jgi:hypothetical protein
MQENGKSPAFAYCAYIDVYVHARAHDPPPGGMGCARIRAVNLTIVA